MQDRLRIGFDGRVLYGPQRGMARYTYNLVSTLVRIAPENEYYVYSDRSLVVDFGDHPGVNVRVLPRKRLWSNTVLASAARADGLNVMHFPYNACWARRVCPTVVTLHDVNPLLDHRFGWRNRLIYVIYLLAMTAVARAVITDSHASKSVIGRTCPLLAKRIFVVHLGISEPFRSAATATQATPPRVQQPYLLFVGGCDPNKNLLTLVHALGCSPLGDHSQVRLAVVGPCPDTRYASEVRATVAQLRLTDHIHWLGSVSDEDLMRLYQGAAAFVCPSFREGFGFPVLEAMACGAPVIASKACSLPELVGDAAMLVNPRDIRELARATAQVLTDTPLVERLRSRGRERVRQFAWEETARQTLAIYRGIIQGS